MNKSVFIDEDEWQKVRLSLGRKVGVVVRLFLGKATRRGHEKPARLESADVGESRGSGQGSRLPPAKRGGERAGRWAKGHKLLSD